MSKYLFVKIKHVQNSPNFSIPKSLDLRNKHKKKKKRVLKKKCSLHVLFVYEEDEGWKEADRLKIK